MVGEGIYLREGEGGEIPGKGAYTWGGEWGGVGEE